MSTVDLLAAPIHEPIPPVPYSTWVWVVGLALIAAIILWFWWVRYFTRPRPAPDLPDSHWTSVRTATLSRIEHVESEYRNGNTDLRSLHLELNTILREFASERLGRDAMWMSSMDIRKFDGADRVADLLAQFEEPSFSFDSSAQAFAATGRAREVITTW